MPSTTTPAGSTPTIRGLPRPLARALESYADRVDVDAIKRAYDFAAEAHAGQTRASGEGYVNHTVEVATILAQLHLDTDTMVTRSPRRMSRVRAILKAEGCVVVRRSVVGAIETAQVGTANYF